MLMKAGMHTLLMCKICLMCHMCPVQALGLNGNKIGDTGMKAFAEAVENGALDKLTVSQLLNALPYAHDSWHAHSPDE